MLNLTKVYCFVVSSNVNANTGQQHKQWSTPLGTAYTPYRIKTGKLSIFSSELSKTLFSTQGILGIMIVTLNHWIYVVAPYDP